MSQPAAPADEAEDLGRVITRQLRRIPDDVRYAAFVEACAAISRYLPPSSGVLASGSPQFWKQLVKCHNCLWCQPFGTTSELHHQTFHQNPRSFLGPPLLPWSNLLCISYRVVVLKIKIK